MVGPFCCNDLKGSPENFWVSSQSHLRKHYRIIQYNRDVSESGNELVEALLSRRGGTRLADDRIALCAL